MGSMAGSKGGISETMKGKLIAMRKNCAPQPKNSSIKAQTVKERKTRQ